ncbi:MULTISPECIES: WD40 repeat domain-containing protein [Pseudanabaena]|uniref:WD40 repeat domain-containing protein n=1 Tax=Pseudanabaena TaxID=1152 RepID=UPI002479ACB7|nr:MULTISPECIES: WD40 repeat domain-containing protein [Pseudanabaena]MEA5490220.1 WD40 repeat domain-containing protein [Pseudanabaena sp. CCNP1317]WGS74693.1 WD40 repeat domain-containing protein [Pseudanabaena galeata CCNP1313]
MASLDYQVLSRRIYSNFPVIGWLLRRWAAWQLAKDDGSGEAVAILAEVVTRSRDRAVREMALAVLNRLRTQDAINGFCRVWVETRHEDLTEILRSRRYVATEPRLRVLSALKVGALDVVKRGGVEVLDFLLAVLNDRDTQVATAAASCVSALENRVVIDELCRRWVESRSSQLEGIIRQGGYVASQPVAVRVLTALKLNQIQEISDGGIEVLDCVLKAFDDRDMEVVRSANVCAVSLTNRGAIDELCKRWASSRNKQLEQIIQKGKYITSQSVETQVLVTLKFYPSQKIKVDSTEVLDFLIEALRDRDNEIVKSASISITQIKDKNIIDVLCKKWIDNPTDSLEYIIRQGGYEPYEASTKALFYFLLGEWQKYEDLDFDQSLLSKAYYGASDSIQKLVADKAKLAGRIEWIKILTNTKKGFSVEEMTDNEWSNFTDILVAHPDRKEIWRFLYHAPVIWSKRLLDNLAKASCKWFRQDEQKTVETLLTLSRKSQEHYFLLSQCLLEIPISTIQGNNQNGFMNQSTYSLAISPDGNVLVSGNGDKTIKRQKEFSGKYVAIKGNGDKAKNSQEEVQLLSQSLWNLTDGRPLKNLSIEYDLAASLVISPDGHILASGSWDSTIRLWSLPNGNYLKTLKGHAYSVYSLSITPDGHTLVSGSGDSTIRLWSLPNGNYLKTLKGHTDSVLSLAITPDGRTLVSGSGDSKIRLWSLPNGNHLKTLKGHISSVYSLSITPDGRILISSGHDGTIRLWSLPNGELLKNIKGHTDSIPTLAISSDGFTLISGSADGKICLWSLPDGNHLKTISGYNFVNSVVTSPNGNFFAAASCDGMIRLWDGININSPISRLTNQYIKLLESQIKESTIEEDVRNALKFTLALIRLRQQFDIDIEDVSSNVQFSEFDIEIDG